MDICWTYDVVLWTSLNDEIFMTNFPLKTWPTVLLPYFLILDYNFTVLQNAYIQIYWFISPSNVAEDIFL